MIDGVRKRKGAMKIVTYNVNGLRQRISQYGSLLKLLDSFNADIICFQETKLRRQDLTSELAIAYGYESFFSCTLTVDKGRTGYSGVATFCRVQSAFCSTEPALPMHADEGVTGMLRDSNSCSNDDPTIEIENFDRKTLVKLDSEGRCVITDHGHFVLFNIYGPRADSNDEERLHFKRNFFTVLQRRWEKLLGEGRRIIVVGDFNIAPTAMDRCDPDPDFENNCFRKWFRSLLENSGGKFSDCFRFKHAQRTKAFTCWPSNSGAELFNYGTRIDHIICAGSCLNHNDHSLFDCHVADCDILTEYKRWTDQTSPGARWKGGLGVKLEGSDHAPVFMTLTDISCVEPHSTPTLSSRYLPMICGVQQTIVSMLKKREASVLAIGTEGDEGNAFQDRNALVRGNGEKRGKKCQSSQLSLRSYFGKSESKIVEEGCSECVVEEKKNESALVEWQRIREFMQNSVPLCKGHKEPCVSRVVKKAGPTFGRRFYVCARAEGPTSNPEANCGYFKWASAKFRPK